ncbi:hypothetical protein AA313_de0204316 [Arthrobotrys entomopaga]|nr:hypothetical protein AA313_de0204316 [Arthrobotrys entomopaga]
MTTKWLPQTRNGWCENLPLYGSYHPEPAYPIRPSPTASRTMEPTPTSANYTVLSMLGVPIKLLFSALTANPPPSQPITTSDTGHKHDWEWAVVTFKQNITTDWRWHREQLILQNEGINSVSSWSDIPEAYSEGDDLRNNAGPKGDHPKLYVGKFHHSVHTDPYTNVLSKFKCSFNAAPVYGNWDYRDSDYYFPAQEWLVNGDTIRKDWDWGKSDSPPPAFFSDGEYDICYLRVDVTS